MSLSDRAHVRGFFSKTLQGGLFSQAPITSHHVDAPQLETLPSAEERVGEGRPDGRELEPNALVIKEEIPIT